MTQLIQNLTLGLLFGGVYALVASGLTLIFGVMKVINIAHGAFLVLASFITYSLWSALGIDPLLGILITSPIIFALGWITYKVAVAPIRTAPMTVTVLLTFGLALVLEGAMGTIWGNNSTSISPAYADQSFTLGPLFLPKVNVYGLVVAIARPCRTGPALDQDVAGPRDPSCRDQSDRGRTGRHQGVLGGRAGLRHRDRRRRRRRCNHRCALPVRSRIALPVDRPAAGHRRARRHGQPQRRGARRRPVRARRNPHGRLHFPVLGHCRALLDRFRRSARQAPRSAGLPSTSGFGDRMTSTTISPTSADSTPQRIKPIWIGRIVAAVAATLILVYPLLSDDRYYQNMIIISLVFAVGASGLNIITGFAGYVSLGQSAFIGLGGYTIGVLATRFDSVSPWLWVPVAGVVAAAVAAGLGLVALRSRGPSFVIITVAFLFLIQVVAVNWESVTGGTAGLLLPLPTWGLDVINWPYYYALIAILALQLAMTWWIRRSKFGMGLIAIREDETKAGTIGINLPVQKVLGFVASSVFVGMAGAVYGYYLTFIDPLGMFAILISVQIILSLLIGGKATLWGPCWAPSSSNPSTRPSTTPWATSAAATRDCSCSADC